jgi:hypothetical protein
MYKFAKVNFANKLNQIPPRNLVQDNKRVIKTQF